MPNRIKSTIEQKITEAIVNKADSLSLYSGSKKESLPKTILNIQNLLNLSLEGFYEEMPAWLTDIASLKSLEIEEAGSVSQVVPNLWKLGQLHKLKLAYVDDLTELPSSFAKLEYLEELNVDGAYFETFPTIISSLTSLQTFSYEYCDCELSDVFNTLSALPRLKKLRLTHYADDSGDFLPESFRRLSGIEELFFNNWTKLQELPEYIGKMRNLRVINISNDDHQLGDTAAIKELPDSFGDLCNLEELDIYGLQDLKRLPVSFSKLSRLKRLDMMGSGIDELQLTPEQWSHLEKLRMHGPLPDFRLCTNLKEFAWFKNRVSIGRGGEAQGTQEAINLPLSPLSQLESLSIFGGTLNDTSFLASLTKLRNLHLSCDFESLPVGFEKLDKLEEVNIWGAKSLTALPEYLGALPSIKRIFLTGCGVKHLPKSVRERQGLHIDVRHCPVQWPE